MNLARRLCFIAAFLTLILVTTGCQQEKGTEEVGDNGKQTEETMEEDTEEEVQDMNEDDEENAAEPIESQMKTTGETLKAEIGQAGEYLDDTAITARIKMEMLKDPLLKNADITVSTAAGMVTFTGTVPSEESADRAIQIATNITSVISVDNQLEVTDE